MDDFTIATLTYLMAYKSQTPSILKKFIHLIKNQFQTSLKTIRTYNGSEFLGQSCQNLFASLGILHEKNCPYTPQQNGSVERFKAQLVAKGYNQVKGIDYHDCLSLVAKAVILVRLFFTIAAAKGWPLHQIDINNASCQWNTEFTKHLHLFGFIQS